MFRYTVDVAFTDARPIIPDQHVSRVVLMAHDDTDARLTACYMIDGRPAAPHLGLRHAVQMVTRIDIVAVEL